MRYASFLLVMAIVGLCGAASNAEQGDVAADDDYVSAEANVTKTSEAAQNARNNLHEAEKAVSKPSHTAQEYEERRHAAREAAHRATQMTLEYVEARKKLQRIEEQNAAKKRSAAASAASDGSQFQSSNPAGSDGSQSRSSAANPLKRLHLKLGRTFDYLQESNAVLQDAASKGLPAMTKPQEVNDPFETAWKKHQDRYDSRPEARSVSAVPPAPAISAGKSESKKADADVAKAKPAMALAEYEAKIDAYERAVSEHNRDAAEFRSSLVQVRADQAAGRAEIDRYNAAVHAFNALPSHERSDAEKRRLKEWSIRLDEANAAMGARLNALTAQRDRITARKKDMDAERTRLTHLGDQLNSKRTPTGTAAIADTSH
jgi:hypothetical protein